MSSPVSLTDEELELKNAFDLLRRVKKLCQAAKASLGAAGKADAEAGKQRKKRNLDEIAGATEEAKRLVKAGAMTIAKVEEKQTFKRSKQLDRKLKESDKEAGVRFQPFSATSYGADSADDPYRSDGMDGGMGRLYGGDTRAQRGTTLYIRGYDLMEEPLKMAFCEFGALLRVHVEERRKSAFVEYATHEEADRAIREMNGNMLNGITLRVTMARRQNYVFRRDDNHSRPWHNIAPAGGREGGRDVVSYDDADE